MKSLLAFTAMIGAAASMATAGVINEVESNNTMGTANFCGNFFYPGDSFVVDGGINPGDVDWFRFNVQSATELIAVTRGRPNTSTGDSVLGLYDSVGNQIAVDDDGGPGLFSLISTDLPNGGTYYLAVSGFPDFSFHGSHEQRFDYKLVVGMNIAPTPGATALLGLGGLVTARRRRTCA